MGDEQIWPTRRASVYKSADPGRPKWKSVFKFIHMRIKRALRYVFLFGPGLLLFLDVSPGFAQTGVGKGFILDTYGSVTSAAGEIISGRASVKGAHFGTTSYNPFLKTDPGVIAFTASQSYRITFRYRIITAPSRGFEVLFYSPTGGARGNFLPSTIITGSAGDMGSATLTNGLGQYSDYEARWNVVGTGSIVVDDVEIADVRTGQVVVREMVEGPAITRGPLNFEVADSKTVPLGAVGQSLQIIRSGTTKDINGDGSREVFLTITTYPDQRPLRPIIIDAGTKLSVETDALFVNGAPTLRHSIMTLFPDINGDGLEDFLFGDAGLDHPPWTGSGIGVGLNLGGGRYRNVSPMVPADLQTTRSYSLAAADLNGDGAAEIILPDQSNGKNTAVLRWNGEGFDAQRDWISQSLWTWPTHLAGQSWLGVHDIDNDGRQDLLVAGDTTQPSFRIVFGSDSGFTSTALLELPDGPFGHTPYEKSLDPSVPMTEGADVAPVVIADLNNDGLLDIFVLEEQVLRYQPGVVTDTNLPNYAELRARGGTVYGQINFRVLMNQGKRQFVEHPSAASQLLGRRLYEGLMAMDLNHDGFTDLVAVYSTKAYGSHRGFTWGTTFFFNDGTGAFQVVDGTALLPTATTNPARAGEQWSLGSFFPTRIEPGRTEGVIAESVGGVLTLYKVVANSSLGPR